jgi:RNA polymerase sigma-70 factor, ECF subfamily
MVRCGVVIIGDDDRCGQNVLASLACHGRALSSERSEFGESAGSRRILTLFTDTELSESDAVLIARLKRGDQAAFTALVRRWELPMVRIAYRVTGDLAEAEDVRQRVLLKLFENSGAVHEPERFAAWIHRAVINAALSALRRRKRREGLNQRLQQQAATVDESHPGARLMADDQTKRLSEALLRLEPQVRALLSLRFDLDLTFHEIAAALGEPVSTIKSRVARGVSRLRTLLADQDESNQHGVRS